MTSILNCWCSAGAWCVCFKKKSFGLLRCRSCGSYCISPPAVANDEELGEFYTSYYESAVTATPSTRHVRTRNSRYWKVVERVPELDRVAERVLDIGCGEGSLCGELKAAGWPSVTGMDISRTRVARARQLHPDVEFADVPLANAGLAPGSLDVAIMDNVIEHVSDPKGQLETIRKLLHAKSRLVLITPNMESGHFRLLGSGWTPELAPHVHIFLFTGASLSRLAQSAGYEVEHFGAFHLEPYPVRYILRRLAGGDVKGALWKAYQETGSIYSRWIKAGPMLYVVAKPAARA